MSVTSHTTTMTSDTADEERAATPTADIDFPGECIFVPRRNEVAEGGYWITLRQSYSVILENRQTDVTDMPTYMLNI